MEMGASDWAVQPQEEPGQLEDPPAKEFCKDSPQVLGVADIAEDGVA